jgi:hypothetical protein
MPNSSKDTISLFTHETERVRGANRNVRLEGKDSQGVGLILTQEAGALALRSEYKASLRLLPNR